METDHAEEGIGESLRSVLQSWTYPLHGLTQDRQIAAADVILLNKTDLVSAADLETTEDLLSKINPAVTVHRTVRADIDIKHVLSIRAYTSSRGLSHAGTPVPDDHDHASHDHEKGHGTHYEMRGISSLRVSCRVLSPEQQERLEVWIRTVLWESQLPEYSADTHDGKPLEVLRCKGIFGTESGQTFVLQGVRNLYELEPLVGDDVGLPEHGKLVFIGKGLDDTVRKSLEKIVQCNE
jgi:G3E family GTPase